MWSLGVEKSVPMKAVPSILIVTKDGSSRGGVGNYFRLFCERFEGRFARIQRVPVGSRAGDYYARRSRRAAYAGEYLQDVSNIVRILRKDPDIRIVQLNPSLIPIPLLRDGIILLIAKKLRRKVVVFFRGWSDRTVASIDKRWLLRFLFASVYGSADHIIVLAQGFTKPLVRWGVKPHVISVSRTMFDGRMVRPSQARQTDHVRFVFLSRISEAKGVGEILKASALLKVKGLHFHVSVHGHGAKADLIDHLKSQSADLGVTDLCEFGPYVDGEEKFAVYSQADVFLLPTYHPEGCPTVALEAMASGLFLICTDVGALKEIIKDGENGRFVRPRDPEDLAEKMEWAIRNISTVRRLGEQNRGYAFRSFECRPIVEQITGIYRELLNA
jgi:glycosyltransferase involved in cell wall biosynthesis